jgi:hypothetical protein
MSITRDTRPVDPEDQARRNRLQDVAKALRSLHAGLLDSVKADYERLNGPIGGPMKYFGLVTNDPFFAWLRTLSGAMALLDERIDDKSKLNDEDLRIVRAEIDVLFTSNDSADFGANFSNRQGEESIAPLHNNLQAVLAELQA